MVMKLFELITLLVAACRAAARVVTMPMEFCHEPDSASTSATTQQMSQVAYGGSWCVGSIDEDPFRTTIAFLQMDIQVSNGTVKEGAIMKSATESTRGALVVGVDPDGDLQGDARHAQTLSMTLSHTQLRRIVNEQLQASTVSTSVVLLMIGVVVLGVLIGIWLTIPRDAEYTKTSYASQDVGAASSTLTSVSRGAAEITEVVPICQQLILLTTEARFQIKLSDLLQLTEGPTLEIKGTSGRTLLTAILAAEGATRMLQISSVGTEHDPRTTVKAIPGSEALVLWGHSRSKEAYGTVEPLPNETASVLKYKGVPVMSIEKDDSRDFGMKAFSLLTKKYLASASAVPSNPIASSDGSHWKLSVTAGADAVLIASCMLGILLLGGGRPSQ